MPSRRLVLTARLISLVFLPLSSSARAGATAPAAAETIDALRPGDTIKAVIVRRGAERELEVTLGPKTERSFKMKPIADPAPMQKAIRDGIFGGR